MGSKENNLKKTVGFLLVECGGSCDEFFKHKGEERFFFARIGNGESVQEFRSALMVFVSC
jgi:hypothetical protein